LAIPLLNDFFLSESPSADPTERVKVWSLVAEATQTGEAKDIYGKLRQYFVKFCTQTLHKICGTNASVALAYLEHYKAFTQALDRSNYVWAKVDEHHVWREFGEGRGWFTAWRMSATSKRDGSYTLGSASVEYLVGRGLLSQSYTPEEKKRAERFMEVRAPAEATVRVRSLALRQWAEYVARPLLAKAIEAPRFFQSLRDLLDGDVKILGEIEASFVDVGVEESQIMAMHLSVSQTRHVQVPETTSIETRREPQEGVGLNA
jgi:hypothetical protein